MPDLETLLLDVRPTPRPEFTAKLDARVAARFPKPIPRWKAKLRALREHAAGLTLATATVGALLLIVVVLVKNVDVGGSNDAADTGSSGSSVAMATPEVATEDSSGS